jgi:uncharacterized phage protein (TIGR01671 family)
MNRVIKFRIWDRFKKEWSNPGLITLSTLELWGHSDNGKIAQQFTGLKDNTGKEIYEGDIVEISSNRNRYQIKYSDWGFVAYWITNKVNSVGKRHDQFKSVLFTNGKDKAYVNLIGNILENPELLCAK